MPEAAVAIIRGQKLGPGASLVKLENDLQRPTAKDWSCGVLRARAAQEVSSNYVWLRAVVDENRAKAGCFRMAWA